MTAKRSTIWSRLSLLAFAVLVTILPEHVAAQVYHPLQTGSRWEYESVADGHQTMTITGDFVVLGATARIRHQEEQDQAYENFWTDDASGSLFLHGARNLTFGFEAAYLPPIEFIRAPLFAGKTWTTYGVRGYHLDGTPYEGDPFDYPFRVYSEGSVSVPAGEFYAYGVGFDMFPIITTDQGNFDVLGRRMPSSATTAGNATEWYAADVGPVQFGHYADPALDFQLVSYELSPTAVLGTSWGTVKARLRSR